MTVFMYQLPYPPSVPSHRSDRTPGVYLFKNTINGKVYVGQSTDLYRRYISHKYSHKIEFQRKFKIVKAFIKYGFDSFEFYVLEKCERKDLTKIEQKWIDAFKSYENDIGYNTLKVAKSGIGFTHTEEAKSKIAEKQKGKKHSDISKEKMRQAHLGKKLTDSHKKKISNKGKKINRPTGIINEKLRFLTKEKLKYLREKRNEGASWSHLAKEANMNQSAVRRAILGQTYRDF